MLQNEPQIALPHRHTTKPLHPKMFRTNPTQILRLHPIDIQNQILIVVCGEVGEDYGFDFFASGKHGGDVVLDGADQMVLGDF